VGKRSDVLQRLIDLYKFERTQAASVTLGDLLLSVLPDLPAHTVVVPVPTISSHIRQRGYDHMKRIARYVAKKRRLTVSYDLIRRTHTTQRSASAAQRKVQAKEAFAVRKPLSNTSPYLLIDDIYTTGSTVRYAAQTLKDAGASDVWVAIIARQTLD
jgi:ComF family protein